MSGVEDIATAGLMAGQLIAISCELSAITGLAFYIIKQRLTKAGN